MNRDMRFKAFLLAIALLVAIVPSERGEAAAKFGSWSPPVNLGVVVNGSFGDFAPQVSKDGLSLYFASTRPAEFGSFGGEDLYVSRRASLDAPWGTPINLGMAVNTSSNERSPALSRDGHYLFFASDRSGGSGALDLWVCWRQATHDDFAWESPQNLGAAVNSTATDAGPGFFENDDYGVPHIYLASNRPGGAGGLDVYLSTIVGGLIQSPVAVVELNTAGLDLTPAVRFDGLEIVIASNRAGGSGGQDLWASTRETVFEPWSTPVNLGPDVNSAASENFPSFSGDRQVLFFTSDRAGGQGGSDLYMSTRTR
jgi:hypothetical protein